MNKYLLVRYGELSLKGNNKKQFIKFQTDYIKKALKNNGVEFTYKSSFSKLEFFFEEEEHLNKAYETMNYIIGISKYSIVTEHESLDSFKDELIEYTKNSGAKTFKVKVKRREQTEKSTDDLIREIATVILQNTDLKVDVRKPELLYEFEMYSTKIVFLSKTKRGIEGLPPGSNGKAVALLSGGIDSPVAAFKMMTRGLQVDFLSFNMPPNTGEDAVNKVKLLAKQLNKFQPQLGKMYFANITPFTDEVRHSYTNRYNLILLRRAFIKIASKLSEKRGYRGIITGDSLGQVASQTIEAQNVIKEAVTSPTMFQPLIGSNKQEIIEVAERIGTYNISIMKGEDTCSLFVPKDPVTKPKLEVAKMIEDSNELLPDILEMIFENIEREEV